MEAISNIKIDKTEIIKLIVIDEHTLGYILPIMPGYGCILHSSILRGSPFGYKSDAIILNNRKVRLATKQDFEDYNCSFEGYEQDAHYEYDRETVS